jgi:hypothetical protein
MSSPDFAGFSASGQPSAGRELGDPIDREVSQARQGPSKDSRESGFLVVEEDHNRNRREDAG